MLQVELNNPLDACDPERYVITHGPTIEEICQGLANNTPVWFRFRKAGERQIHEREFHIFGVDALTGHSTSERPVEFRITISGYPGSQHNWAKIDYKPKTQRGLSF